MKLVERFFGLRRYLQPGGLVKFAQIAASRREDALDHARTAWLRWTGPLFGIQIGAHSLVRRGVVLSTKHGGSIRIGEHCEILAPSRILTHGGHITIGDFCSINPACILYGHGGLMLGKGVHVAAYTVIIPSNHVFSDPERFIFEQSEFSRGISIKDDVWIGTHCAILDGVCVEKGCVIGAGAVVNRSTAPYGIYGGVPARFIKSR